MLQTKINYYTFALDFESLHFTNQNMIINKPQLIKTQPEQKSNY